MLAEFSVYPLGKKEGLSEEVARFVKIVQESGLDYQLTSMGTILEGDWDGVMETIRKCHFALKEDFDRIETTVKIDDQVGRENRLTDKVRSVEEKL